ncbi:hypothetical protein BV133_1721 [Blastochloris viridis]|uniref:Uncharacterized protein n=1 Tax=Blastochloris viridis TaxID=1079 RepID=A0A182D1N7_BLAVI|nr:hypothetical protein BV133_1721 [Blastochloris viridis]
MGGRPVGRGHLSVRRVETILTFGPGSTASYALQPQSWRYGPCAALSHRKFRPV